MNARVLVPREEIEAVLDTPFNGFDPQVYIYFAENNPDGEYAYSIAYRTFCDHYDQCWDWWQHVFNIAAQNGWYVHTVDVEPSRPGFLFEYIPKPDLTPIPAQPPVPQTTVPEQTLTPLQTVNINGQLHHFVHTPDSNLLDVENSYVTPKQSSDRGSPVNEDRPSDSTG